MPCEENIDFGELVDDISEFLSLLDSVNQDFVFSQDTIINVMARYREAYQKAELVLEKLSDNITSKIFCSLINRFGLDEQLDSIYEVADHLYEEVDNLNTNIENVANLTYEEIVEEVQRLTQPLINLRGSVIDEVREKTTDMFSILVEAGAKEADIQEAVENAIFENDIKDFIRQVFDNVLDQTIERLNRSHGRNG